MEDQPELEWYLPEDGGYACRRQHPRSAVPLHCSGSGHDKQQRKTDSREVVSGSTAAKRGPNRPRLRTRGTIHEALFRF